LAINPSYIALGPVYATTSKVMPWIPQGVERVKQWTRLLGEQYPLVAIGGIDLDRAKTLKETGVGSVAMISAITQAADYQSATNALLQLWE
jgi:hydroxymethylpyrimidine kinase/phosphomethylpyrimidine kinase/thiamine-phosphate diphosphorylase